MSASATSLSPTGSPTTIRRLDPNASAVAEVARGGINLPDSPTIARLKVAVPPKDPLIEKYHQAWKLLRKSDNFAARSLFIEVDSIFGADKSNPLKSAGCNIGIAHTYPDYEPDREIHAKKAKELLDSTFEQMGIENPPGIVKNQATFRAFIEMRFLYSQFNRLGTEEAVHQDVLTRMRLCKERVDPLDYFYVRLEAAERLFTEGDSVLACMIMNEVMPTLGGYNNPEFTLADALCNLKLASFLPEGNERERHAVTAERLAFDAYDRKKELYANDKAKGLFLNRFIILFEGLSHLIPANRYGYEKITEKLAECKNELKNLPSAEKPNDSWKTARIFIAFSIAAAVIVGAALLGRRYITRLN